MRLFLDPFVCVLLQRWDGKVQLSLAGIREANRGLNQSKPLLMCRLVRLIFYPAEGQAGHTSRRDGVVHVLFSVLFMTSDRSIIYSEAKLME